MKEDNEKHVKVEIPGHLQPRLQDLEEETRKSIGKLEEELQTASKNAKRELNRTCNQIFEFNSLKVRVPQEIMAAMQEHLLSSAAVFSNLDALYSEFPELTLLFLREVLSEQSSEEQRETGQLKLKFEDKLREDCIDYSGREAILLGISKMLEKESGSVVFLSESSLQTKLSMRVLFSQFLSHMVEFEEVLEDLSFSDLEGQNNLRDFVE